MSTIIEKVNRLSNYKSDIKNAIISKGQSAGDDMSTYADAIQAIQTGGGEDDLVKLIEGTLTEYRFPDDVVVSSTSNAPFRGANIEKVDLNRVTVLPSYAFEGCSRLKEIIGLENVVRMGSFTLSETAIEYANLPNCTIFSNNIFAQNNVLKEIYTPYSVGEMYGCQLCTKLEYALLGGSIVKSSSVGLIAFWGCSSLKYVDYYAVSQIPQLQATNAFTNTPSTMKIVVPDHLYDEWIAATNWTTMADQIVKNSDTTQWGDLNSYRAKYN